MLFSCAFNQLPYHKRRKGQAASFLFHLSSIYSVLNLAVDHQRLIRHVGGLFVIREEVDGVDNLGWAAKCDSKGASKSRLFVLTQLRQSMRIPLELWRNHSFVDGLVWTTIEVSLPSFPRLSLSAKD
jgi:hypothetical protein